MGQVLRAYKARLADGGLAQDPAQSVAAEALDVLATKLSKFSLFGHRERGIYLHGPVGAGKSMLMDLFFEHVHFGPKARVHFHDFMAEAHQLLGKFRGKNVTDPIQPAADVLARRYKILCFDEFQVSDIADAMILGRLFTALFARELIVVATSNRPPDDLYKDGLNRQLFLPFIDLLKQHCDVLEIRAAKDYRLDRLMAAPIWHTPIGPASDAALDQAFLDLTHNSPPRPWKTTINGRTLVAPRQAAGVARFAFEELCAVALGAADYLALARQFHTLIIDRIPRLGAHNRNEAKRFVTLIDALYETKTKLVASADAEPNALYPSGDGAFEFERCASRLYEMRGIDYLQAPRIVPDSPHNPSTIVWG